MSITSTVILTKEAPGEAKVLWSLREKVANLQKGSRVWEFVKTPLSVRGSGLRGPETLLCIIVIFLDKKE